MWHRKQKRTRTAETAQARKSTSDVVIKELTAVSSFSSVCVKSLSSSTHTHTHTLTSLPYPSKKKKEKKKKISS